MRLILTALVATLLIGGSVLAQDLPVCEDGVPAGTYVSSTDTYYFGPGDSPAGLAESYGSPQWQQFVELNPYLEDRITLDVTVGDRTYEAYADVRICEPLVGLQVLGLEIADLTGDPPLEETEDSVEAAAPVTMGMIQDSNVAESGINWWLVFIILAVVAASVWAYFNRDKIPTLLESVKFSRQSTEDDGTPGGNEESFPSVVTWERPENAPEGPAFDPDGMTRESAPARMMEGAVAYAEMAGMRITERPQLLQVQEGEARGSYYTIWRDESRQLRRILPEGSWRRMFRGLFQFPGVEEPEWLYFDPPCANPILFGGERTEPGPDFEWRLGQNLAVSEEYRRLDVPITEPIRSPEEAEEAKVQEHDDLAVIRVRENEVVVSQGDSRVVCGVEGQWAMWRSQEGNIVVAENGRTPVEIEEGRVRGRAFSEPFADLAILPQATGEQDSQLGLKLGPGTDQGAETDPAAEEVAAGASPDQG